MQPRLKHRPLLPARALLSPVWLGALALLALNDHFLKGSSLLPGFVTGKLSDVAGLIVAPTLLATLLFVRSRRGWLWSHLAIGSVFAGIQLSPAFAELWSSLMGLVGFRWTIVSDPWDLIALPALAASLVFMPRLMAQRPRALLRRSGEWSMAGVGLLCCVATSPPPGGMDHPPFTADVYFHNGTSQQLVVRVRPLAAPVDLDCEQIERDPGRLLTEQLFGPAQSWTVLENANFRLLDGDRIEFDCHAALVEVDNVTPAIVFWMDGQFDFKMVEGEGIDPSHDGWVSLDSDDGNGEWDSGLGIVHPVEDSPDGEGVCAPQPDALRLAWDDAIPSGHWVLQSVNAGADGCLALDLATGFEAEQQIPGERWYLCVPESVFPFDEGARVSILPIWSSGGLVGTVEGIEMVELDENGAAELPGGAQLRASKGTGIAELWDMQVAVVPDFSCDLAPELACGTVARGASVTVGGGNYPTANLQVGATPQQLAGTDESSVEVYLAHAQERVALNPECAEGPDVIGNDIELVAVRRGGQ